MFFKKLSIILLKSSIFFYKKCTNKVLVDFYSVFFFPLGVQSLYINGNPDWCYCIRIYQRKELRCLQQSMERILRLLPWSSQFDTRRPQEAELLDYFRDLCLKKKGLPLQCGLFTQWLIRWPNQSMVWV